MGDSLIVVDMGTGETVSDFALGGEFTCAILDSGSIKVQATFCEEGGDMLSRGTSLCSHVVCLRTTLTHLTLYSCLVDM